MADTEIDKVNEKTLLSKEMTSTEEETVSLKLDQKYIPPKTKKNLSPAVRKIVEERNLDINNLEGSGKDGRISKGDLLNLMGDAPEPSVRKESHGPEERVKMSRLRLTVAKRLKEAQDSAAMLTTFNEVNMQSIVEMRSDYKEDFQKKYSVKLGFMSFFVKSCVVALKNFPAVNAEIDGTDIIYKNYYNIGVAVGTDKGLVVPVLKDADTMTFGDIEQQIVELSSKAKEGSLTIDDLTGGTFTISNGGVYGSMLSTPIINRPQSGILGMHNIQKRAVVVDEEIVIRPMMYLAFSYDHRIIDGKESVGFLISIKNLLENPSKLILGV